MRNPGRISIVITSLLLLISIALLGRYVYGYSGQGSPRQDRQNAEQVAVEFMQQLFLRNNLQGAQRLAAPSLNNTMSGFVSATDYLGVVANIRFELPLAARLVELTEAAPVKQAQIRLSGKAHDGTISYARVDLTLKQQGGSWQISQLDPSAIQHAAQPGSLLPAR